MPHCEVRAVIFDTASKLYLSSFYILPAAAIRKRAQGAQGNRPPPEPQVSANWEYQQGLQSLYVAVPNHVDNPNAALVFEFLIYGENNNPDAGEGEKRNDKGNQVTVGWASIPLHKLSA